MTASASTSAAARQKIGLFGGTFEPPHVGHLAAAWNVRQILGLDSVWLVVANDPWQKSDRAVTPAETRLRWVEAAVADTPGLEASAIEIEAGGATYTIDTVTALRAARPDVEWSVVVGADVVSGLDTWHRADELAQMIDVVAVDRPGSPRAEAPAGWQVRWVEVPPVDISSSHLRALARSGRDLRFLVPDAVAEQIRRDGSYRAGGAS